nr:12960_t:CDS:2 [Entrophospora candida]
MNSLFSGSDANKIIVGTKSTKFYAIDPTTKKLIKTFDNNERDNENECPFLPKDALYICMNAYKIRIFENGITKRNVTYTEYIPHSYDTSIELIHKTKPHNNDLYIAAPNGDILSTNSYSTRNEWHQVLRSPLKVDNNDDETCQLGSPLYPSCIEGPSPLYSPSSSSPSLENNHSSSASPSIDKADSIISLTRIGFSLFSIILLIFIGIIYWNKYNNKNGRHFFNKLSLTPLLGTIAQKYNDFNETFFSKDSSGNGINQVKSNKKEVGNKKKKKGNKNHNNNNNNANNKKVELKNDDLKINGTTTSNKETTITNNNNSQNLDVNLPTSTIENNASSNISTAAVNGEFKLNSLMITDTVLGYGSHGTIVYKGSFEGKEVAVKRLLLDFYDIAHHEVSLLQESDDHPNVIRYYCKQQCDRFLYIALELCPASLHDFIERGSMFEHAHLIESLHPSKILYQIISGLHHLHSIKLVHRDIKPQNILIAASKHKKTTKKKGVIVYEKSKIRVLISDFGLCKKLEGDSSSFHNTTNNIGGTIGWRAPELLSHTSLSSSPDNNTTAADAWTSVDQSNCSFTSSGSLNSEEDCPRRITKAIDIFSAGCLFYYVLSRGCHPFGDRYSREINILKGVYDLNKLDDIEKEGIEARDLIERMIERDPEKRPNAETVMTHPYFWSSSKRLGFLQDASDRFEIEERDPPSPLLNRLEQDSSKIIGIDWYKRIDKILVENLGKYRKYDGAKIRDLLRALRNKKNHYQDLPDHVKRSLGEIPNGFLFYFVSRFPELMLHVYYVIAESESLKNESIFSHYFEIPGEI